MHYRILTSFCMILNLLGFLHPYQNFALFLQFGVHNSTYSTNFYPFVIILPTVYFILFVCLFVWTFLLTNVWGLDVKSLIELDLQFKTWHSRLFQGSYFNVFVINPSFYQIHDRFLSKSSKGIKKKIRNCLVVIKEIDH